MFNEVYRNKTVLITGNTGFKGSWLTSWLLDLGANIIGLSKDIPTSPSMYEVLELESKIKHYNENVKNKKAVYKIIHENEPDFIFHLAAQPIVSSSFKDPLETIETNVIGTANILDALRDYKKKISVVMITSDKCYDNVEWVWGYKETDKLGGKDPYSASKGAAELVFKTYYESFFKDSKNIFMSSVRAGNVIGGGDWALDRIVPDCYRAWSKNEAVKVRSPKATRPWQHVLEPLSGYLNIGEKLYNDEKLSGESYNFGPVADNNFTVDDLLKDLYISKSDSNLDDHFVEYKENTEFDECKLLKLNCDKALYDFKWKPTLNYNMTVEFVGHWYNSFYEEKENMYELTTSQIKHYINTAKDKNIPWANENQ